MPRPLRPGTAVPRLAGARHAAAADLDGHQIKPIALALLEHAEGLGGRPFGLDEAARAVGLPEPDGLLLTALSYLTAHAGAALALVPVRRAADGTEIPVPDHPRLIRIPGGTLRLPDPAGTIDLRIEPAVPEVQAASLAVSGPAGCARRPRGRRFRVGTS